MNRKLTIWIIENLLSMRNRLLFISMLLVTLTSVSYCQNDPPITYGASYVSDWGRNLSGGIETGNFYMGLIDLGLSVDFEAANLWKGGEFYIQIENTHGSTPTANLVGDLQVFSNIENGDGTYLYMLWYKHNFDKLSVTLGVHDMNSEFIFSDYAGTYLNSSFGIQPSASLNLPTSIFPKPVLGAILSYNINEKINIRSAIYDGEPVSDVNDRYNLDFTLSTNEGFLSVSEIQYNFSIINGLAGSYKLGFMYHSGEFKNLSETSPATKTGNSNIYFIADQQLTKTIGAFTQLGYADNDFNYCPLYLGMGLNITPKFIKREKDILGLAIAYAKVSDQATDFDLDNETVIELTYNLQLNDNISLQPDFQYIINTGAISTIENAFVGFIRFKIEF